MFKICGYKVSSKSANGKRVYTVGESLVTNAVINRFNANINSFAIMADNLRTNDAA